MKEIEMRIMELIEERYSCSQIMLLLSQDMNQTENEQLIKAMYGLSGGMFLKRTCGTLTGGCCLLALYGDIYAEAEKMVKEFGIWFEKTFGYCNCKELIGEDDNKMASLCPKLIEDSFVKCMEIITKAGKDPYEL